MNSSFEVMTKRLFNKGNYVLQLSGIRSRALMMYELVYKPALCIPKLFVGKADDRCEGHYFEVQLAHPWPFSVNRFKTTYPSPMPSLCDNEMGISTETGVCLLCAGMVVSVEKFCVVQVL